MDIKQDVLHADFQTEKQSDLVEIANNEVGYSEYVEGRDQAFSDEEHRHVRWKIDLVIVPLFFFTQMLQTIDKTALNYANIFGYQKALGLKGLEFNYLSGMIYAGYFFGLAPCSWLIGRFPAQRVLAVACFSWGLLVLLLTRCRTYGSALGVRVRIPMGRTLGTSKTLANPSTHRF